MNYSYLLSGLIIGLALFFIFIQLKSFSSNDSHSMSSHASIGQGAQERSWWRVSTWDKREQSSRGKLGKFLTVFSYMFVLCFILVGTFYEGIVVNTFEPDVVVSEVVEVVPGRKYSGKSMEAAPSTKIKAEYNGKIITATVEDAPYVSNQILGDRIRLKVWLNGLVAKAYVK